MATYLYECPIHGEFEASHSVKDNLEECPTCKEEGVITKVVRLIPCGISFVLKGGGWSREGYSK